MAWRAINDTVNESLTLAELSDFSERLFWRLVAHADPWGRLAGDTAKVRARCCALLNRTDQEIATALDELEATYRISRYEADGVRVLEVSDWEQNQPTDVLGRNGKRFNSRFPDRVSRDARRSAAQRGSPPAESESESEIEKKDVAKATSSIVARIYAHWREERSKTDPRYDRMSDGRQAKIRARLKDGFTEEQLCEAIDGVALDPWEDRARHDDLTVVFRNTESVDRFLSFGDKRKRVAAAACPECGTGGGQHVAGCASANGSGTGMVSGENPERGSVASAPNALVETPVPDDLLEGLS